jgi:hypothetical protein
VVRGERREVYLAERQYLLPDRTQAELATGHELLHQERPVARPSRERRRELGIIPRHRALRDPDRRILPRRLDDRRVAPPPPHLRAGVDHPPRRDREPRRREDRVDPVLPPGQREDRRAAPGQGEPHQLDHRGDTRLPRAHARHPFAEVEDDVELRIRHPRAPLLGRPRDAEADGDVADVAQRDLHRLHRAEHIGHIRRGAGGGGGLVVQDPDSHGRSP